MCIKRIEKEMYNYQNIVQILSKNPNIKTIKIKNIHKKSEIRTIYRGKNLSFL